MALFEDDKTPQIVAFRYFDPTGAAGHWEDVVSKKIIACLSN